MPDSFAVLVTDPCIVFREDEDNGGVLYHPGTDRAYSVNILGARIWTMLSDGKSPDELIIDLQASLSPPPASLAEDVEMFLDSLIQNQLIRKNE
jgi:Coenzyme PQQ synthesis protein D (PqqD)